MFFDDRSFYQLEIFVQPGGAREAMVFVSSSLLEIQQALRYALNTADDIYMTVWYGREINLMIYQQGQLSERVNLLPLIKIEIPGFPVLRFDASGRIRGIDFPDRPSYGDPQADFTISTDDFVDLILSDDFQFKVNIAWDNAAISPLAMPLAQPGDEVLIRTRYTQQTRSVPYGYTSFEDGFCRGPAFPWEN